MQNEDTGAEPDDGHARRRPVFQEPQRFLRQGAVIADQAADNDDIVVMPGVHQPCIRLHLHAAARLHAAQRCREHRPLTQDRPGTVRLVGGKTQHINEIRKG
ncbi:hypothetical protein D3C86_1266170 [compost metagenome]